MTRVSQLLQGAREALAYAITASTIPDVVDCLMGFEHGYAQATDTTHTHTTIPQASGKLIPNRGNRHA